MLQIFDRNVKLSDLIRKIAEEKRKADEMRHALKAKEEKAQEAKETFNNLQVPYIVITL